jgi:hypothetical protein
VSIPTRILLALVAFVVVIAALHVALPILGIERGEWRYAVAMGICVAIVSAVWGQTARKDRPPPKSN